MSANTCFIRPNIFLNRAYARSSRNIYFILKHFFERESLEKTLLLLFFLADCFFIGIYEVSLMSLIKFLPLIHSYEILFLLLSYHLNKNKNFKFYLLITLPSGHHFDFLFNNIKTKVTTVKIFVQRGWFTYCISFTLSRVV